MRKTLKCVALCALISAAVWGFTLISDRETLNQELIRLHVVANSDSQEDQAVKLRVRDAILQNIQADLTNVADVDQARAYLEENLSKLQQAANAVLRQYGYDCGAVVTLCREAFDTRDYDTFTLPAGVYESLRIVIGEGEGKNWWCVAFPALCMEATKEAFEDTAVGAGFSEPLTDSLTGEHEIRFFFLDALGRIQAKIKETTGQMTGGRLDYASAFAAFSA